VEAHREGWERISIRSTTQLGRSSFGRGRNGNETGRMKVMRFRGSPDADLRKKCESKTFKIVDGFDLIGGNLKG
jgi:hypothetical protein